MRKHGVLPRHAPPEGAVQLRAESQLAHVVVLLGGDDVALLLQALVFEALEAGVPALDLLRLGVQGSGVGGGGGFREMRGRDGRGEGRGFAVGGEAGGGAVVGGLEWLGEAVSFV